MSITPTKKIISDLIKIKGERIEKTNKKIEIMKKLDDSLLFLRSYNSDLIRRWETGTVYDNLTEQLKLLGNIITQAIESASYIYFLERKVLGEK